MELANIQVNINENQLMNVYKTNVTPPEVVLLRMLHGDDSVNNVTLASNAKPDKRSTADEIARLKKVYGEKKFKLAYPGAAPQIPTKFSDVGINFAKQIGAEAKATLAAKADKKNQNKADKKDESEGAGPQEVTVDDVAAE